MRKPSTSLLIGIALGLLGGVFFAWHFAPRPSFLKGLLRSLPQELISLPRPCPEQASVVAIFGQSNASNWIVPAYTGTIPSNLLQYDWKRNRCAVYREPLLGNDNSAGSLFTPTLVALARKRPSHSFLVVPFARGGSSVLDWAYGYLSRQNELVLDQLIARGLPPNIFFMAPGRERCSCGRAQAGGFALRTLTDAS